MTDGPFGIGIDVGGTFTDAVLMSPTQSWRAKALTTPSDPGEGVLNACRLLADKADLPLGDVLSAVDRFSLGTTAVTNVLTSMNGRRLGLITTAGFEDEVAIAKGRRVDRDGWVAPPPELVARRHVRGVRERIDRTGAVLVPLDVDDLLKAATSLVEDGIEALAVSFVWSFRNPMHEEAATAVLREAFPDLPVMSGAELNPVIREYERTTFALLNAYCVGAFTGVDRLQSELQRYGLRVPLLLVNCSGGVMTMEAAREQPISLVHSGPSSGVAAAVALSERRGEPDVICCDMGGTSFDISIITHGQPGRTTRGELFGVMTSLPTIDVVSIGAGGGSIGWVDARGVLRVGPQSAGSVPGPACYGQGGTAPTITDALVVLGYIDPASFLGGKMPLDRGAAVRACAGVGETLGLAADEVAWGIREISLNSVVKATRSVLAVRGLPSDGHVIASFGGSGGLFTAELARELHLDRVVIPETASVFSAYGAISADLRRERARSLNIGAPFDADVVARTAGVLQSQVCAELAGDGVPEAEQLVTVLADMRFRGQVSELTIPMVPGPVDDEALARLVDDFIAEYTRRFGRGALVLGAGLEINTLRVVALARTAPRQHGLMSTPVVEGQAVPSGSRDIQLGRGAMRTEVLTFDIAHLLPGQGGVGPACLEGQDTTVWVPVGTRFSKDADHSIVLEIDHTAASPTDSLSKEA